MNNTIEKEIWKDVSGYEGLYEVSNLGRIKSLAREDVYLWQGQVVTRGRKELIMSLSLDKDGYQLVSLGKNGKEKPKKCIDLLLKNLYRILTITRSLITKT